MSVDVEAHMLKTGRYSNGMRLSPLVFVLGIHAAILWGLVHNAATITLPKIESTPVVVSLISEPKVAPAVEPKPPTPIKREPLKPKTEPVRPKPEQITPQPVANTPIVSNTPTPAEKVVEAMPVSPPAYSPKPMEAPPTLPIVPPRHDAAYLDNPAPIYPAISRRMNEQGKVLLRVYVTAEGQAGKVELKKSSGYSRLDTAAMDAVRQWRFVPAKQGEQTIAAWVEVPINFGLDS